MAVAIVYFSLVLKLQPRLASNIIGDNLHHQGFVRDGHAVGFYSNLDAWAAIRRSGHCCSAPTQVQ
jgi:hypothetical protein